MKEPHKTYIGDVRCDAGSVFDYTSYFGTVDLSITMQLRLLGNYSVMLELLEPLLCCLARHFFFLLLSFPDVIKTCYSTSVCQASRNQACTNTACALPVAIAAGSSVGCLPRSVASVLLSRGPAGGEIRTLAALVMPPRWCASLLARIRRASGVFPRAFCRLLPANTTS